MESRFLTTDASSINLDLITYIYWATAEESGELTATINFTCSRHITFTGADAEALREAIAADVPDDGADLLMETLGNRIKQEAEAEQTDAADVPDDGADLLMETLGNRIKQEAEAEQTEQPKSKAAKKPAKQ